jgi:three-Cys-motif partner protein
MSLKDSDRRKWIYSEHAKVKHLLLAKYLPAWITILGSSSPRICYFDGFAGRGEYADGSPGSPILALKAIEQVYNNTRVRGFEYNCIFIENDPDNFNNLKEVVERERPNFPSAGNVYYIHSDFDTFINNELDKLEARDK